MTWERLTTFAAGVITTLQQSFAEPATYQQLALVAAIYALAYLIAGRLRRLYPALTDPPDVPGAHPAVRAVRRLNWLLVPVMAIVLLRVAVDVSQPVLGRSWVVQTALSIAVLLLFYRFVRRFVSSRPLANTVLWLGGPLLGLQFVGVLGRLVAILESIALTVGSINVSLYGLIRVVLFGSLLFWLGRLSNRTGQDIIRRQHQLDLRTREVAAKLLQVSIAAAVFVPLKYVYPSRMHVLRGATNLATGAWLLAVAAALAVPGAAWREGVLKASLAFPLYYLGLSFWLGGKLRRGT